METMFWLDGFDIPKTMREGKGHSCIAFPKSYCVVDTETTGLSPDWDELIEIGAIRYTDGNEAERFQSLIQPPIQCDGTYISDFISDLTGITNEMLRAAPKLDAVISAFSHFLGTDIIVGYNVGFDINFLYDAFEKHLGKPLSNDYIDVMRYARKLFPDMRHHRLKDMVGKFQIQHEQAHRSISDVIATEECFKLLQDEVIRQFGTQEAFIGAFKRKRTYQSETKASSIVGDSLKNDPDCPLYNRYCVFTGKLEKFTRKQAMQIVADLGGINEDGVTKNTNFLILGNNDYCTTIKDGKSSKQKKAEQLKIKGQDIEIIPETVFYDMLGEI